MGDDGGYTEEEEEEEEEEEVSVSNSRWHERCRSRLCRPPVWLYGAPPRIFTQVDIRSPSPLSTQVGPADWTHRGLSRVQCEGSAQRRGVKTEDRRTDEQGTPVVLACTTTTATRTCTCRHVLCEETGTLGTTFYDDMRKAMRLGL